MPGVSGVERLVLFPRTQASLVTVCLLSAIYLIKELTLYPKTGLAAKGELSFAFHQLSMLGVLAVLQVEAAMME